MTTFSLRKIFAGALLLALTWSAQSAITLSDPLPINPLLKMGKLENGLTYYIQKNSKPEKRVELRLVVKAGSILEDDDQQGLAHFTEHMAFNGSRHFKKHELISYLQSIGIKFGADLNAYTSFDETVYILPVPTTKKENLETGFLVLEDWAQGLTMNDADIDSERHIILEEARLGKGAGDRMNKQLYPALFNGSKYAERLPIGKEDIISNFKHDAIKRFYADWYRPDLMAVVVIGDIEPEQAEQMIKAHFAQLKNPANERPRNYAKIPTRDASAGLVITDKEATNNVVMIRYPVQPSTPDKSIADYRQSLIKNLSSAILNQRLQELTQQATPPFIGGGSSIGALAHGYESFSSAAIIGRTGVESAITALIQENERARQFGFSSAELERTKKNHLRFFETAYNERDKSNSSEYAAEYIRHFLTEESIPGIVNEYAYATELLPGITLDEVNHYAQKNIPDNIPKLATYLGSNKEGEIIPTNTQLLNWVNSAEKAPVLANSDKAIPTSLLAQAPNAGSITAETVNVRLGTTELTLSNGLKVILKPTDFKSDQVLLSASRFGGLSLFDDADKYNALYATAVTQSMGLASYTPTDLQKILAGKSLSFNTSLSNYTEHLSGYAASSDIETLFQSIYLRFANPRKDPDLYTAFISGMQDLTKNSMARPESVFSNTLSTTLYNNHPRLSLAPKPDDFTHINLDRTSAIYGERFNSAKGFTFILIGSFDLEKIKPLIATYLASLPTTELSTSYHDLNIRPVTGVVKKEVHSGSEPKSQVSIIFTGPANYSKEENMRFNALIEVMNLRITDVLREKLTLIYSGGMSGSIDRIPYQNYRIAINLPCGPDNVDKVIAATFAEIEKIKSETPPEPVKDQGQDQDQKQAKEKINSAGPTQEELNKVKLNWIKNHNIAMRTNEQWLRYLQDATLFNTDTTELLTVENRVNAITLADVRESAKRYLNTENYVQVVLYPEK
ncbi:M16 family metallopeptidase [Solimicrobium silvestre]|uniref:Insulinase (Peptidase family M16) n=1 Tax=Solimicrobium silvestre TaxID=2099400 RepID=A0A2S9H452_9BURK|nr:M16 family metallopeptidase [Solimicrobium silvestre]PRC94750.1 Insulinase (Peptidase family M16) [Solimicrobium silvestre]